MSGARRVRRPGSHCAVCRSNRDEDRCVERCVFDARPLGTWGCGHLGEGLWAPLPLGGGKEGVDGG